MSKARDEYTNSLRSNICYNYQTYILRDNAHMYICELEQRVSQLIDSKVKLESEKAELLATLRIAMDNKRRVLYKDNIFETLEKLQKEN